MECQGECKREKTCTGSVKKVLVSGLGFKLPFEFQYCETAIQEDKRRGFFVEIVDETVSTESDYYTGISYPNG